ncbi:MAG: sigma-54-dependent Fis family transcriptional regulator [Alphaproteobacteria bacterium]|nr:sigma-54-dependent Fis family transcriptional regulator [Alphaproteobacteria bacterium]
MLLEGRKVGLVEDDPVMGESLAQSLSLEGGEVVWWTSGEEAYRALKTGAPDAVICDIRLPDMGGQDLFRRLAAATPLPPFLFVTAYGDIDQAVSLMREGAADYVTKPFDVGLVIERVRTLIQRSTAAQAAGALGVSAQMQEVETSLRRVCDLTSPLLLTGETGVGKEVCARLLHTISSRSKEPFVTVNCAAIPQSIIEQELFGFRGSGHQAFHRGFAERARGGVLFLDEVGELPVAVQAKLLRLVETREYHRLGGEQPVIFHGRIVCATHNDLQQLIRAGRFREDFFYRISGMTIDIPALRHRSDDIPWLLDLYAERFRAGSAPQKRAVSDLTVEAALDYPWPGNVRELRNRMERAVAMAKSDWIMPGDLFPEYADVSASTESAFATLSEARDMAERRQIERALRETEGHIIEAARLLGVSRTTLWEKMKRLGVHGETP